MKFNLNKINLMIIMKIKQKEKSNCKDQIIITFSNLILNLIIAFSLNYLTVAFHTILNYLENNQCCLLTIPIFLIIIKKILYHLV
jgi:hypothetical protein